jgi:hypothetical protein
MSQRIQPSNRAALSNPAGGTTFDTHLWLDADSAAGRALAESAQITAADLPAVITGHQVLRRATTEQMAQAPGAWRTGTPEPSPWT